MAVSCTPVPVRSAKVIASALDRPAALTGDDRSEFGELLVRHDCAGRDGMVQFAETAGLREPVRDIESPRARTSRIDLVLVLGIRAHRGDVLAGLEPVGHQDRLFCGRRGDDDIGAADGFARIANRRRPECRASRARSAASFCALAWSRAQIRADLIGRTSVKRLELQPRLHAGAEDRRDAWRLRRDRCLAATAPAAAVRTSVR